MADAQHNTPNKWNAIYRMITNKSAYMLMDSILCLCIVGLMLSIFLPGLYLNHQKMQEKIYQTQIWHDFYKYSQAYMSSNMWGESWDFQDGQHNHVQLVCQKYGCWMDINDEHRLSVISKEGPGEDTENENEEL